MNVVRKECCVKVRVKVREIGSEKDRKVIPVVPYYTKDPGCRI